MIESIVKTLSQVYIVIDGIDEIAEREHFLAFVHRVRRLDNLNIIIVSRPLQDIENGLSQVMKLEIETGMINEDIHTYIELRLRDDPKLRSIKSPLKAEIEIKLFSQTDGMSFP